MNTSRKSLLGFLLLLVLSSAWYFMSRSIHTTILISSDNLNTQQDEEESNKVKSFLMQTHSNNDNYKPNLPLCTMDQIKTGIWEPVRHDKPPYIPIYLQTRNECYSFKELEMASYFDNYAWQPSAVSNGLCHYPRFERQEFCQLAKNKTIAFLGDSLTLELFSDLAHQAGFRVDVDAVWDKKNTHATFVLNKNSSCNQTATLIYRRTFWLEALSEFLQDYTPNVLVINTGAWYNPDKKFLNYVER